MKKACHLCKCLHCNELFCPDYRNKGRQNFCSKPECRKAGKKASQKRWLLKTENQNYFKDKVHVERVRQWRLKHPDYWRRKPKKAVLALQETCHAQPIDPELETKHESSISQEPLQETCLEKWIMKHPLVVGLIGHLLGLPLQEDIERIIDNLIVRGRDILDQPSKRLLKGNLVYDDQKTASGSG